MHILLKTCINNNILGKERKNKYKKEYEEK